MAKSTYKVLNIINNQGSEHQSHNKVSPQAC